MIAEKEIACKLTRLCCTVSQILGPYCKRLHIVSSHNSREPLRVFLKHLQQPSSSAFTTVNRSSSPTSNHHPSFCPRLSRARPTTPPPLVHPTTSTSPVSCLNFAHIYCSGSYTPLLCHHKSAAARTRCSSSRAASGEVRTAPYSASLSCPQLRANRGRAPYITHLGTRWAAPSANASIRMPSLPSCLYVNSPIQPPSHTPGPFPLKPLSYSSNGLMSRAFPFAPTPPSYTIILHGLLRKDAYSLTSELWEPIESQTIPFKTNAGRIS